MIELLERIVGLEPESLSGVVLGLSACIPAIVANDDREARWRLIDGVMEERLSELKAHRPKAAGLLPALWLWAAGPTRVAEQWERSERCWVELPRAFPTAFLEDGRIALGIEGWFMRPVIDAAKVRAEAALLRAWRHRGDERQGALIEEAMATSALLADVEGEEAPLHRARLHLLAGNARAAREALAELRLDDRELGKPARDLGDRLLVDAYLLGRDLKAARERLSKSNADPTTGRHVALLLAAEGRLDKAWATATRAEGIFEVYCPWWSVEETRKLIEVARAHGRWDPARDGLFARPGR